MRRAIGFIVFGTIAFACASAPSVRVEQSPEFSAPSKPHVSVFGVFHDGRMSEPAWLTLAPKISRALDSPMCEIGFGQRMRGAQPELASSIERRIRENGIDDDVLSRVSPNAVGEFVLVLMSYRALPTRRDGGLAHANAQPAPMMRGGMRGGGGRGGGGGHYVQPEEEHVFELSASLYSVQAKKLVAQIDLRESGDDLEAAMDAFTQKLRTLLPGARCVGWNWPDTDELDGAAPLADLDATPPP